jgi:hypothetical protein
MKEADEWRHRNTAVYRQRNTAKERRQQNIEKVRRQRNGDGVILEKRRHKTPWMDGERGCGGCFANFPSDFHDGVLIWERTDCCKFLLHVMYMSLGTLSRLILSGDIA